MVVGVSYGTQATSRAQEQVRQILASPDCNAAVQAGHEVLVGKAAQSFNKDGNITDQAAVANLEESFTSFVKLTDALSKQTEEDNLMTLKQPFVNDAYINFPTGRLSFKEAQQIFSTIPFEIDLIDRNDRFAWFSDKPNREHVRHVNEINETVDECHPPKALPAVKAIINSFKDGSRDVVERPLIDRKRSNRKVAVTPWEKYQNRQEEREKAAKKQKRPSRIGAKLPRLKHQKHRRLLKRMSILVGIFLVILLFAGYFATPISHISKIDPFER